MSNAHATAPRVSGQYVDRESARASTSPHTVLIDGQVYRSDNLRGVALSVPQALAQASREETRWTIVSPVGKEVA